jgi:hypothetical protein
VLDVASIGDNNVGAEGLVSATGLLLFLVQELNIKIDSNENINRLFMVIAPDS